MRSAHRFEDRSNAEAGSLRQVVARLAEENTALRRVAEDRLHDIKWQSDKIANLRTELDESERRRRNLTATILELKEDRAKILIQVSGLQDALGSTKKKSRWGRR